MSFESHDEAARELELFISSDRDLYNQTLQPILKNLIIKVAKGVYDSNKAAVAFGYLMESGAKKYAEEYGGTWNVMFPPAVRREAAKAFVKGFRGRGRARQLRQLLAQEIPEGTVTRIAIYIAADNTPSGNPQRGWIITDNDGRFVDFVDEGYEGYHALKNAHPGIAETIRIPVAKSFYKEIKKEKTSSRR